MSTFPFPFLLLLLAGGPPELIAIPDLFGAVESTIPTTFMVPCRCKPGQPCPPWRIEDLAIVPEREAAPCWDGLDDGRTGKTLVPHEPDAEARKIRRLGGQAAQAVRVAYLSERHLSIYLARSMTTPGTAHSQNSLLCQTFDRKSGKVMALAQLLGPRLAERIVERVQRTLSDHEYSLATLGKDLAFAGAGYTVSGENLLLLPGRSPAELPAVVLCAAAPSHNEGTIMPVRLDDLPLLFLFQPQP